MPLSLGSFPLALGRGGKSGFRRFVCLQLGCRFVELLAEPRHGLSHRALTVGNDRSVTCLVHYLADLLHQLGNIRFRRHTQLRRTDLDFLVLIHRYLLGSCDNLGKIAVYFR